MRAIPSGCAWRRLLWLALRRYHKTGESARLWRMKFKIGVREKKTEVLFFLLSASWKREREKSFASFRTMWPRHGYGHQRGRPRFCNDADGHAATEKKWVMKDPPSENVKRKMKIERDEKYRLGSAVDRHLGQDLPLFRQLIYDAISRVF